MTSGAAEQLARRLTLEEAAVAGGAQPFVAVHDDLPARQDDLRLAGHLAALVARVVDVHVVSLGRDGVPGSRVVDDEVRIGPDPDGALLSLEPEHARRRGADDLDPSVRREMAANHATIMKE